MLSRSLAALRHPRLLTPPTASATYTTLMSAPRPPRHRQPRRGPSNGQAVNRTPATGLATAIPATSRDASTTAHSDVKFQDLVDQKKLLPSIKANIEYEYMTEVQATTLFPALSGQDIFARAKTGTGKTLAFLIPTIQRILGSKREKGKISALVVSPTRELARQIYEEALILTRNTDIGVQCVVGGEKIAKEQRALAQSRCDILIATPGRFSDHAKNSGLVPMLTNVTTVVLDEADRLLDKGFAKDVMGLLDCLPDRQYQPRQTLLFSATVPDNVAAMASTALLPSYQFISTVNDSDQSTHAHVKQEYIYTPTGDTYPFLHKYISDRLAEAPKTTKIIVFCVTANAARLLYDTFSAVSPALPVPVLQIHSRMSQPQRDKASKSFAEANGAILFSSDVVARGMHYDDVSAVVQVGFPSEPAQYIHRLGRTARAGKEGHGLLVVAPHEAPLLKQKGIVDQPLQELPDHATILGPDLNPSRKIIADALAQVANDVKTKAYGAWLGYYKAFCRPLGWSPTALVQAANKFAANELRYVSEGADAGLPPPVHKMVIGKMGLKGVPGINIDSTPKVSTRHPRAGGSASAPRPIRA